MLRYLTAGESHGQGLVVVIEGLPAGLEVTVEMIQAEMARRRLGYGRGPRQRFEVDEDFVEEMRHDDEGLLRFAFLWLRFSLFGEPTMKMKAEVVEAFKGSLDKKQLFAKGASEREAR